MMMLIGDYKTPNETPYSQKLVYHNAVNYGFINFQEFKFHSKREFNAENYIEYLGTHCDHIVLKELYKPDFFEGIKAVIQNHNNRIEFYDTITLYLDKRP